MDAKDVIKHHLQNKNNPPSYTNLTIAKLANCGKVQVSNYLKGKVKIPKERLHYLLNSLQQNMHPEKFNELRNDLKPFL